MTPVVPSKTTESFAPFLSAVYWMFAYPVTSIVRSQFSSKLTRTNLIAWYALVMTNLRFQRSQVDHSAPARRRCRGPPIGEPRFISQRARGLTFDMSGRLGPAQLAQGCPLDGGVRPQLTAATQAKRTVVWHRRRT